MTELLFNLGRVVATPGALEALEEAQEALAGREPGAAVTTRQPSAPGLVLTVAIEPGTVQAGQALRLRRFRPAELARWLEPVIDAALTDLAIQHGAQPAALAWSVKVQP